MKTIMFILMLAIIPLSMSAQVYTNGMYFKSDQTFEVDKNIHETKTTNQSEIIILSNTTRVSVEPNSHFMINSFFQEIYTNNIPSKAKFGSHSLAMSLNNGDVYVRFNGYDENSACMISTSLADIQLKNGLFYIKTTESKTIIISLEGTLVYFGGGNMEKTLSAGTAVIATPNEVKILEYKVSFSTQKIKDTAVVEMISDIKKRFDKTENVVFVDVYGKIVGIDMN